MQETVSVLLTVETWFVVYDEPDSQPEFVFYGDVGNATDPEVLFPPGTQIGTFNLRTSLNPASLSEQDLQNSEVKDPDQRANFTTVPFQWIDEHGVPKETPAAFSVGRVGGEKANIFACNALRASDAREVYPVRLLVMYQGDIFWTPDPTVINLPENPQQVVVQA